MKNNKKNIVVIITIIILLLFCIIIIPEQYRKIRYVEFKTIGVLKYPRLSHKSLIIGDDILTYQGDYENILFNPTVIETYNIKTKESIEDKEISNILKLGALDRLNSWKHYFIIQRIGINQRFGIKNTIEYYNVKTKKFDRTIDINDNYPSNILILDNGDLFLYDSSNAIKYLFEKNHFTKSNCKINSKASNLSTTAIPLKDNSILVISTENAYIYKDNMCKPIESIHFKANEFTNGFYDRIDAPFFMPFGDNHFAVFTFNPYKHLNKIVLYNVNNFRIETVQEFKTETIPYALNSGKIIKLDDNRIIIIGGTWRIFPPIFTLASNKIYLYDYKQNKLSQITSLQYFPYIYSSTSDYSVVVTSEQQLYIIGNYNIYNNKDIKMLDLSERGEKW